MFIKISLISLFCISQLIAQDLVIQPMQIKIPDNALFNETKENIDQSLAVKFYQDQVITPYAKDIKQFKGDKFFDFLSVILKGYQLKDIKIIQSLYVKSARRLFVNMSKGAKEKRLEFYSKLSSAKLHYIMKFNKGHIVYWTTDDGKVLKNYIVFEDGKYQLAPIKLDPKSDKNLWFVDIYHMYAPFEIYDATIDNPSVLIKSGSKQTLRFTLKKEGNWINIFNRPEIESDYVSHIKVQDNDKRNVHKDINDKKLELDIELGAKNFKKNGVTTLYILESSYPIGKITKELYKRAQKITVRVR